MTLLRRRRNGPGGWINSIIGANSPYSAMPERLGTSKNFYEFFGGRGGRLNFYGSPIFRKDFSVVVRVCRRVTFCAYYKCGIPRCVLLVAID